MKKIGLLFGALLVATLAHAGIIYSNTTTDTGNSEFYATGPYTELGDQITFDPGQTERRIDSASTQFYNSGPSGTFNATLRFYAIGSPVAAQIGTSFTKTSLAIGSNAILTMTFDNIGGLLLPDNVIWTVSVNPTPYSDPLMNVGLNFFSPPTIGSSPTFNFGPPDGIQAFYIGNNSGFARYKSLDPTTGDFYFSVQSVPEPASYAMAAAGLLAIGLLRRRK